MSKLLILPVLIVAALAWFWLSGGFADLATWAATEQRHFQNGIAQSLRSLRAREVGALTALLALCFAYGFVHAVGPGHGKVLIGGYGLGRKVPMFRLVAISLVASLGQSATAIAIVYAGVWAFHLTREHLVGVAEGLMAPLSYGAIALVGTWLVIRGCRRIMPRRSTHDHAHHHHHHEHDESCSHRHGPTLQEIENTGSLRETLALIASIAIRPCSGAIFVLLITWQMGIALAGIAATLAMGLGTASVTIAVACAATGLRGSFVSALSGSPLMTRVVPVLEIAAGLTITVLAGGLLLTALA